MVWLQPPDHPFSFGTQDMMARYWTTAQAQHRTMIGELIAAVASKHLKGLYVAPPQDGEPFGLDAIAIPVYRTTPKGRLSPRFIIVSGTEMRMNRGAGLIEKLVIFKMKAFLKDCPKGWLKLKQRKRASCR